MGNNLSEQTSENLATIQEFEQLMNFESTGQFHIHIYTEESNEDKQNALYLIEKLKEAASTGIIRVSVSKGFVYPEGPHMFPNWEIGISHRYLAFVITFLMYHRKNNTVMIHPTGVEEYINHTQRELWLGEKKPISEEFLLELDIKAAEAAERVSEWFK
eukprot:TRINITY_DN1407_c0_g1_i1.p2 TRINITY_DN1407_c0_g1~~TRINITY_DN1407_c0_g1_i1.p2  ORF type:complete len:159 (+),score=37.23 TRINITY_DN1407_c0_g1_i1:100-576(+)